MTAASPLPPLPLSWRLRATAAAIVIPPLLQTTSLARLSVLLGAPPRRDGGGGLDDVALARWVDRVLRRLPDPWHRTCLRRAAVLYYLLRRAGRPVELCIGVRRNGGPLIAHAWLMRDGVPYLEPEPDAAMHTIIARFPEELAARRRPVNGRDGAASADGAEPRLQPRT